MNLKAILTLIGITCLVAPLTVSAQNMRTMFDPAVQVNDDVITNFEIAQRARLLELLGLQSNFRQTAIEQLIDERIYLQAGRSQNITLAEEDIFAGMEEFLLRKVSPLLC